MAPRGERGGWSVESAPPAVVEVMQYLERGRALLDADAIVLKCFTHVLEVVYVESADGRLMVSDLGETFGYLEEEGGDRYKRLARETIERLCQERGAIVVDVADMWPHITVNTAAFDEVTQAVAVVAAAKDHVFKVAHQALRTNSA